MSGFTYKYGLLTALLLLSSSLMAADKKKEPVVFIPTYQGINLGVELGKPLLGLISNDKGYSIKADVNLKNTWFPTVELGYSSYDRTAESGTRCLASGNYFKIGVNKSLTYLGNKAQNMFYAGAHYGFTSFKYILNHLAWTDNYWGNNALTDLVDQPGVVGWLELTVGVRVNVWGPFSLGWSGQYKSTLHVSGGSYSNPAYIPGYGENLKPMAGLAFHLYCQLPF
ncbi:MAG TPA: DUF6048 family protein [Bacteroidales bacterium]|nr:DUF6048 family protein [Bacteroidales bacterium]